MPQTVSEKIFKAFFANLVQLQGVSPETIEGLEFLHSANKLGSNPHLARLIQDMENRHAQNQDADR